MNIWKWFGWDDRKARIQKNESNNWHSTIQWAMFCLAAVALGFLWTVAAN